MAREPHDPEAEEPVEDEDVDPDGDELATFTRLGTKRRWIPVLPFWGVLLRGRDAPLFRQDIRPTYHPSVGFARDIFVAISLNWLVDVLGLTWLFHGYFVTLEPWWVAWAIAAPLAIAFSSAFATFAISMVRKPIQEPQFRVSVLLGATFLAAAVTGFLLPLAGFDWVPQYGELIQYGSIGALLVGAILSLVSTFGFQDGSMVFTRAFVMFTLAYFVAGPLHETMFYKELMEEYRSQQVDEVTDEIAEKQAQRDSERNDLVASCLKRASLPPDPECTEAKRRLGRAELLVSAIEFVKDEELLGENAVANRAYLVDKAKELEATQVIGMIGAGSTGKRGRGPRYRQALTIEPEAKRGLEEAKAHEARCLEAVGQCEAEAIDAPRIATLNEELTTLEGRVERVKSGEDLPGVVERAEALDVITNGDGSEEDEGRSAWMWSRLAAAWFLAMVMPLIVLVMKLTAGDKLEPYLRKRWAGR